MLRVMHVFGLEGTCQSCNKRKADFVVEFGAGDSSVIKVKLCPKCYFTLGKLILNPDGRKNAGQIGGNSDEKTEN